MTGSGQLETRRPGTWRSLIALLIQSAFWFVVLQVLGPVLEDIVGRPALEAIAVGLVLVGFGAVLVVALRKGLPEIFATPVTGPIRRRSDPKDGRRGR